MKVQTAETSVFDVPDTGTLTLSPSAYSTARTIRSKGVSGKMISITAVHTCTHADCISATYANWFKCAHLELPETCLTTRVLSRQSSCALAGRCRSVNLHWDPERLYDTQGQLILSTFTTYSSKVASAVVNPALWSGSH